MSLTLELPPQVETLLRQRAEAAGQDIQHIAVAVLALGLSLNDEGFFAAIEGIQQGLDDFEQGRFSALKTLSPSKTKSTACPWKHDLPGFAYQECGTETHRGT
jgi:predicted transcriptional regulator